MAKTSAGDRWRAFVRRKSSGGETSAPACEFVAAMSDDPSLDGRDVEAELDAIVLRVSGRRLSPLVVGEHPEFRSVTDVFQVGAARAERVQRYLPSGSTVLEFGGNVGTIGRAVSPHVDRVVSVDTDPVMRVYGERLSPGVEFIDPDQLGGEEFDGELFDGAYSIGVFEHLSRDEQRTALETVHRHLKPGAPFVVDLGTARSAVLDEVGRLAEPDFSSRQVPLVTVGLLLNKPAGSAGADTDPGGRFVVNDESVVADVLDGEVVVVNLDSGAYYVLQGSAAVIWELLAEGTSVTAVVAHLAAAGDDDADLIGEWIDDFLTQLLDEQLLLPMTADVAAAQVDAPIAGHDVAVPIEPPVMFRYTDMQFLIQMDPIRDYDESGWPVRRAAQVIRPDE